MARWSNQPDSDKNDIIWKEVVKSNKSAVLEKKKCYYYRIKERFLREKKLKYNVVLIWVQIQTNQMKIRFWDNGKFVDWIFEILINYSACWSVIRWNNSVRDVF